MKHLRLYEAIRLIQRQGSIRKAAELLAVSPSALNRSVQAFEDAMGVEVFERVPVGVRLTSAGELLLGVVERHLIEFEDLQRQLGMLRDGQFGRLRVGMTDDIAAGLPLLAMQDLEDELTGISTDTLCGDALRLLRQRQVDIAIATNPVTDRSVEVLTSQKIRLCAFANGVQVGANNRIGLWDIATTRLVLPPEGTGSRAVISHAFRRHAVDEGVATTVPAPHLVQAMATGPRVCVFAQSVFDTPEAPAFLDPLPMEIGSVDVSVLRLTGVPLSTAAQRLLRHLERRLNEAT